MPRQHAAIGVAGLDHPLARRADDPTALCSPIRAADVQACRADHIAVPEPDVINRVARSSANDPGPEDDPAAD